MSVDPSTYPRRLLLAVVGLTPQVVTETLYALVKQREPAFVPTHLRLVTTVEGAERIRLQLLDPESGAFPAFAQQHAPGLGPALAQCQVDVLTDADDRPLVDISSASDSAGAANRIAAIVRDETSHIDSAIWASIAGGRKTMGFLLGYAMSLYGRDQDRLSHVLVSPPFQDHPEFFFPPARPRVLVATQGKRPVRTDEAGLVLTDIPFLRLRHGLPRHLIDARTSFAETIAEAQAALDTPTLMLIPERTEAVLGRKPIVLPPIEFAFLLWLAQRRLARTPHGGAMSWREAKATEFLATYTTIDRAKNQVDRVRRSLKDGIGKDWFEQRVTRLNKLVDDALGLAASAYRLSRSGRRPNTRYGLPSDLTSIVIETERKRGGQHGK